jgi:hypothetical protein
MEVMRASRHSAGQVFMKVIKLKFVSGTVILAVLESQKHV